MKRRILSLLLITLICLSLATNAICYDKDEHNAVMKKVLFGNEKYTNKEKGDDIVRLEYASYFAIDQAGTDREKDYDDLKDRYKVKKLPKFDDIALTNINKGNHRMYTHKGWDYDYSSDYGKEFDAKWRARKNILRTTANKVFDFGFFNELFGNYCTKCDSFCALIYYVHVLADYLEAEDEYKSSVDQMIPLAKKNASDKAPDVFWELNKHLALLFSGQEDRREYQNLFLELKDLAEDARSLSTGDGSMASMTNEEYEQMCEYERLLMELLSDKVPVLLSHEPFFQQVFFAI